ncbi:MAG: glycosyltransferase family 2 protein [candidate division WOR-3 bacterium]
MQSGSETFPTLTVVFINFNSTRFLDQALASLAAAEPEAAIEKVVVDNASKDREEVKAVCTRHGCRLLALARNVGYGAAANRGFRVARGRYVAVANPDVEFSAGSMSALVRLMEATPGCGAVSPQLVYPDGTPQPSARRFPRLRFALAGRRSVTARLFPGLSRVQEFQYQGIEQAQAPVPVEAVIGTCVLFRREALAAVSGFDERYFMFAEDVDICRRLGQAGWQVLLEPRVKVRHFYGGVRQRFRRLTGFHRLRALRQFFEEDQPASLRALLTFGFVAYLCVTEAAGLVGLGEFEYSWRGPARN